MLTAESINTSADRHRTINLIKHYQKNPATYFKNVLGVESLEGYQAEVIQAVANHDRVAVSACHDVGKSFLMARIAIWFLTMHKNSKVITTAPTFNQVEKILWSEIRAAHSKAKVNLGGKLNLTDWTISPEWFAIGLSPRNEVSGGSDNGQGTQSSFQGFHAEHLLVIFDEATGIKPAVWTMVEGLLTSAHVKFVAIANPTSKNSDFYGCFRSAAWHKIYLSCFNSPNLIANGITDIKKLEKEIEKVRAMNDAQASLYLKSYKVIRPYLLTTKWVIENTMKWGLSHPLTVSKILGKFPESGDNTLIPLGFVESAQLREVIPVASHDRKVIGVDVARSGPDSSVLTALHGKMQTHREEHFKKDNMEIAGEVIAMSDKIGGADVICVDATGVGSGVCDALKEAKRSGRLPKNCEIREVQFGEKVDCDTPHDVHCKEGKHKTCEKARFFNMKAKLFGNLADDVKAENGLALLDDAVYLEELPSIVFSYNSKGQMVIESKDEYKKRTGRGSPDNADSLALANFGRYHDLKIGTFTKEIKTTARPISGGLRATKVW